MAETGSGRVDAFTRPLRASSRARINSPASSMPVQGASQFLPCTLSLLSGRFLNSSDSALAKDSANTVSAASASASDKAASASDKTGAAAQETLAEANNTSVAESQEVSASSGAGSSLNAKLSLERKKELLRHEILQNITLILNSHSHPRLADLQGDQSLAFSVLGMGLADFCGHSYASLSLAQLQQRIKEQIVYFEPRLDPTSVQVLLLTDPLSSVTERSGHTINLEISAKIHPRLLAGQVFKCSTLLDLESGANVVHLKSGRGQD